MTTDQYGRSPEQFLEELFQCEYCAECGGDADDHDAIINFPMEGLFFAHCRHPLRMIFPTTNSEWN
jgi:hypothetical protein